MRRMKVIALLLSIGICALDGFAQNVSTANLRGTVKNAAGIAVDSATVTARDDAHSLQRTTQTTPMATMCFRCFRREPTR